jgi:lipid II:glycine glycyltransferase (peptidoglycan interpeptide bridge formation enzyme)
VTTVKEIGDKSTWEKFNLASPNPTFLQSWVWGEFQKNLGRSIYRLGVFRDKKLLGVSLLVEERAKVGAFLYCPGGPVFSEWKKEYLFPWVEASKKVALDNNLGFLRIDPRKIKKPTVAFIKTLGFLPATDTQPHCTAIIDLTKTEEELRHDLSSSTRYNINAGERKGVKVREGKRDEINVFSALLKETSQRKTLTLPKEKNYHQKQFETLIKEGLMNLFIAEAGSESLSAALVARYTDTAYYLHAANSLRQRKLRASYPLVWSTILDAKNRGLKKFDFWGVAPTSDPKHSWAGVTSFKLSFGAQRECYAPSFDLPFKSSYRLTRLAESARKPLRKILRFGR